MCQKPTGEERSVAESLDSHTYIYIYIYNRIIASCCYQEWNTFATKSGLH